jgi:Na+/H+-dicarboxylate symporter
MKKIPLYVKILIGMGLGVIWSIIAQNYELMDFTNDWIKPFGTIFINGLKLIAVPLILVSLIDGISGLKDITKLSRIGGKTIAFYLFTTVLAITIGLLLVNTIKPGKFLTPEKREELREAYASDAQLRVTEAQSEQEKGPLQMFVNIVPDNVFQSMTDNRAMLQVIFFSFMFGIAMIFVGEEKVKNVKGFFSGVNVIILKIVDIIMRYSPIGVFALLGSLSIDASMFKALGVYSLTVLAGLALMVVVLYPLIIRIFTHIKYRHFLK